MRTSDASSIFQDDRHSAQCGDLRIPYIAPLTLLPEQVLCANGLISQEEAETMEKTTRSQAQSSLWHKERAGRITASQFGLVCKKMKQLDQNSDAPLSAAFFKQIYGQNTFHSQPTAYGIR